MTTALPQIIDALVAQAEAVVPVGTLVIDGEGGTTSDPGNFLIVGSSNADGEGDVTAGTARQQWRTARAGASFDGARLEQGAVNLLAAAHTGNDVQKEARDAAVAIMDAVLGLCTQDPSLGLQSVTQTTPGADVRIFQVRTDEGSLWTFVEFSIAYMAHI